MNFFEQQAKARRNSTRLVVLFALAVIGMVLAIDLAVLLVAGANWTLLAVTVGTLAVIGLARCTGSPRCAGGDAVRLRSAARRSA